MRVAFVGAEAFPYAKVGGLGDVLGALPYQLSQLGLETQVYLPHYRGIAAESFAETRFFFDTKQETAKLSRAIHHGVEYIFIGLEDFDRERPYGYWDDERRFTRFSLAVASCAKADVIHAHDWQAALLPILRAIGRLDVPTVFTIHNLAYQGRWNADAFFAWTELPRSLFHIDALEYFGDVNLMKGAIVCADALTTVSPAYAEEICTPSFGFGLDGVLRAHRKKLRGVLNGIDTEYWNPAEDPHLPERFDSGPKSRTTCEEALRRELSISGPVLGMVTRLVSQKGVDLVLGALDDLLMMGFSLAVLGSGDPDLENALDRAQQAQPNKVAYVRGFNEPLAHRIYGGAHAVLIPSRYEPCGLAQMIAQRYGSIPVARSVGGLKDTIEEGVTGFLFDSEHSEGLSAAVCRLKHAKNVGAMRQAAMRKDFSWVSSAREYESLYAEVLRGYGG